MAVATHSSSGSSSGSSSSQAVAGRGSSSSQSKCMLHVVAAAACRHGWLIRTHSDSVGETHIANDIS